MVIVKGSDRMKNYIVIVCNCNGSYYLRPDLEFSESLGDDVLWPADEWDKESIENYIFDDAQKYSYTYKIEEF